MRRNHESRRRAITIAMLQAMVVGLIVPSFTILSTLIALFIFKALNIFVKAFLMTLFGLTGFGVGTALFLKVLKKMRLTPRFEENRERTD
ncbi:MAG: hypothetical protein QW701_06640 [Candidatus Nezhaarchaeales archaeon]